MPAVATALTSAPPARVWRVLSHITAWPQWSPKVEAVTAEGMTVGRTAPEGVNGTVTTTGPEPQQAGEQTAYRIEQPPLPSSVWTVTAWHPGCSFTWCTRGVSSTHTATYAQRPATHGTEITVSLAWTGATAWLARAVYGPVAVRYAESHLAALVQQCERGHPDTGHGDRS